MPTGADELSRIAQIESENESLRRERDEAIKRAEIAEGAAEEHKKLLDFTLSSVPLCPYEGECPNKFPTCKDCWLDYAKKEASNGH
jgi:hypothetical protein